MKRSLGILLLAGVLSSLSVSAQTVPEPHALATAQRLLAALQDGDREAFVTDAADAFRQALTDEQMGALHATFGPRLAAGYTLRWLDRLERQGQHMHLFTLRFHDGSDPLVVRLVLHSKQVQGFWLQ